jgi:pilus assembly protein CpaE
MSGPLQALVALDDEVDRGLVDTLVAGRVGATVLDYLDIGGPTSSGYGSGDVLIVACVDYTGEVRTYIREAARQHPSRPIVLLGPGGHNGYLRDAFSSGVEDVVALPSDHGGEVDDTFVSHFAFALEKAVVRKRDTDVDKPIEESRMICVLGLKGGAGKTLTTVNLGASLADRGHSVALVDIDLQFGDLALAMGLSPERTIYDLVRSGGSLDAEKLRDFLAAHPSGASALLAPLRPDHAAAVQVPFLREVLRLLREMHEYVIVDTPPNFTPEVIATVDMSTDVLLIAMRDTLSLKNAKLALETLDRMGYDPDAIRIVLNRANTKVGIDGQDILGILGRDVDVFIPSHRDITRSINRGEPIALTSGSSGKAFRELADLYRGQMGGTGRETSPPRETSEAELSPPAEEAESSNGSEASAHKRRRRFALRRS